MPKENMMCASVPLVHGIAIRLYSNYSLLTIGFYPFHSFWH